MDWHDCSPASGSCQPPIPFVAVPVPSPVVAPRAAGRRWSPRNQHSPTPKLRRGAFVVEPKPNETPPPARGDIFRRAFRARPEWEVAACLRQCLAPRQPSAVFGVRVGSCPRCASKTESHPPLAPVLREAGECARLQRRCWFALEIHPEVGTSPWPAPRVGPTLEPHVLASHTPGTKVATSQPGLPSASGSRPRTRGAFKPLRPPNGRW